MSHATSSASQVHSQNLVLSPFRHGHDRGCGRNHDGGGNDAVLDHRDGPCRHGNCPCNGEAGLEEGLESLIAYAHPYLQ